MRKIVLGSLLMLGIMSSCVSKKQYEQSKANYMQALEDVAARDRTIADLNARKEGGVDQINLLKDRIESEKRNAEQLSKALENCLAQSNTSSVNISSLVTEINKSNRYIQQLIASKDRSDSLNVVLTNNLTKSLSASEKSDIDVKVQKGVVFISLSDNMLYKSGSYEITSAAKESLSKIAKVIKDYPTYDVLIEGNTDDVPISSTNIRNNWDLSALRASSVVQSLQNDFGVAPKRMTAGGRGEFNSITSNDTAAGRAKNRRTEIIILPKLEEFMKLIGQAPTN